MASAFIHTHERHNNPYSLGSEDMMLKKGMKMGKVGTEASNDLRVLKRKSMSLNHDNFHGSPAMVSLDISKLSRGQRSELRKKLKRNIEEVRTLVTKIDLLVDSIQNPKQTPSALKSDSKHHTLSGEAKPLTLRADINGLGRKDVASVVSDPASSSGETPRDMPKEMSQREARLARQPSVVVPEASAGTPNEKMKRTPKANPTYVNDEFLSGKDKMPPPEKAKPKKVAGGQGRDPRRQKVEGARAKRMSDMLKQCTTLLRKLMSHKHGWVFNDPVDAEKLGLHDYHAIIKKPMDLGTIKKRLHLKQYPTPAEFAADVELTFTNAMTYNPVGHDVYVMAELLKNMFEDWRRNMNKKLEEEKRRVDREEEMLANDEDSLEEPGDVRRGERDLHSLTRGKSSSRLGSQPKPRPDDIGKRPMTFEEKRKLSVNLEKLPGDKLERIVQIIKKKNPDLGQNEDEIEVDIDSFDNDTLWELDRFVTNYMKSRGKKAKSKAQAQGGEFQTAAPAGNAGRKSRLGGDGFEKDVDIDDDLAPTKFAPVVIDKGRDSSSSGSDSSDSGSSDSDSDSGSSSGSDSDAEEGQTGGAGPKASHDKSIADCPPQPLQDPVGTDPAREPKDGPGPVQEATKRDDPVVQEEIPSERPVVQEKSPPVRQVSPEKQLRAAMLKGRFADLIVKSQEKSLPDNKNDKVDPEKLKRDREEMERRQREEKARLHAEAKAAEAMKRKAEAEAALVEKQKREVERDEARRALQRMEKTVEIDENSAILNDLERLRSGPLESMLGSAHDVGNHEEGSPDGSSTIALQGGSNPLEQLGLFMRNEEDEDEPHDDEDEEMDGESAEAVKADAAGDEDEAVDVEDVEDGEIDVD
ncbi:hypothetical protein M758_1G107600 [Ceratodon purpureus]|nr:hypothetical protein M758_1G107600 [Ceratodon purpureus]